MEKAINTEKCVDLESTIDWLIKDNENNGDFDDWCNESEERSITCVHQNGLDRWIRNTLNLWYGGPVAKYFNGIGIYHADDMSSIILTSMHRKLNNKDFELEAQIKFFRDYWQEVDPVVNTGEFE